MRSLADFTIEHDAFQSPVIFVGDLNCTSFDTLRGFANAVTILNKDTHLHPFSFDCNDVPTGATSVTTARCMRIDAIMYQAHSYGRVAYHMDRNGSTVELLHVCY